MIERYVYGNPIETEAILTKPQKQDGESNLITHTFVKNTYKDMYGNDKVEEKEGFKYTLSENDIVYGLGQQIRGINKRGWKYKNYNSDQPLQIESQESLYGAHNFVLVSGKKHIGFFFDYPTAITFDIGYTDMDEMYIYPDDFNLEMYVITGESDISVVKEFRALIGKSYIPPKWAFGYAQSRWGYRTSDDVREVARKHRENHIPLDAINLDLDYLDNYKDFTTNPEKFPDFKELVQEMKDMHIHLVPIIDAGVKEEEGYDIFEEGKEKGYFVKDKDGKDFRLGVWPGYCRFPDMLNEEAGAWFADKYKFLTDMGIDGFWNDMNEPAIFYSDKGIKKMYEDIDSYKDISLDATTFFELKSKVNSVSNSDDDYKAFYHNYKGSNIRHDKVHNLFGYNMTKAAALGFKRNVPNKNILLYSRSSYVGMHRYSGIWQGDNNSWWSHILQNVKMSANLNMVGFLYNGADLGGFGANVTEDLLIRWLSFGLFMPLMRNHSAFDCRGQEVYRYKNMDMMASLIRLRYRLIPYIYEKFVSSVNNDDMLVAPLGFLYPDDEIARHTEDEVVFGYDFIIAPVYEQNAPGRNVYLPEDVTMIRFRNAEIVEKTEYKKGTYFVFMPLGDVCIFVRKGHAVKLCECTEWVTD